MGINKLLAVLAACVALFSPVVLGDPEEIEIESTNDKIDGCGNSLVLGLVGTKCAPTRAGGVCLGDDDYNSWTRAKEPSGFDAFGHDMQECGGSCGGEILSSTGCGGVFTGFDCPEQGTYAFCVSQCMRGLIPQGAGNAPLSDPVNVVYYADFTVNPILGPNYTEPCADCMGLLAQCTADNCKLECLASGAKIQGCQKCNIEFCNDDFHTCAGIDPTILHDEGFNVILVTALSLSAFGMILLFSFHVSRQRRLRVAIEKNMNLHDLAKMANMQQNPDGEDNMADLEDFDELKALQNDPFQAGQYQAAPGGMAVVAPGGAQGMSDYERAYYQQQQALQQGQAPPQFGQKTERVRTMALTGKQAAVFSTQAAQLRVLHPFTGNNEDELTVSAGETIMGIEESDNWWLARTDGGSVGLVPSNYVKILEQDAGNVQF